MTEQSSREGTPPVVRSSRPALLRFPVAQFLGSLVLMFVATPFLMSFKRGDLLESALITIMLTMAILSVSESRRAFFVALILAIPAVGGKWIGHFGPELFPPSISQAFALLLIAFVAIELLRFILRTPRVNSEVLCAGVSIYLLLGLIWAFAYMLLGRLNAEAFVFNAGDAASRSMTTANAFYFSFITLATVGYGDITPLSGGARMLAVMEAVSGTLYMAILIARLVSLYSSAAAAETLRLNTSRSPC